MKTVLLVVSLMIGSSSIVLAQDTSGDLAEIVQQYAVAMGLSNTNQPLQSIHLNGILTYRGQDQPIKISRSAAGKSEIETVGRDGQPQFIVYNGETTVLRSGEEETPVDDPRVATFSRMMANLEDAIINHSAKGYEVHLRGAANVDGTATHHLSVHYSEGYVEEWYIDQESHLLLKRSADFKYRDSSATQSIYYFDHEEVDGVMIAQYLERSEFHYVRGYEIESVSVSR